MRRSGWDTEGWKTVAFLIQEKGVDDTSRQEHKRVTAHKELGAMTDVEVEEGCDGEQGDKQTQIRDGQLFWALFTRSLVFPCLQQSSSNNFSTGGGAGQGPRKGEGAGASRPLEGAIG